MSNKTIRSILIKSGYFAAIVAAIYGAKTAAETAYEYEFLHGVLGFIIGAMIGFEFILICYAIGNSLMDIERTADATEDLLNEFRKGISIELTEVKQNTNPSSSVSKNSKLSDSPQLSPTEKWTCKKCGQPNEQHLSSCKGCGAYK